MNGRTSLAVTLSLAVALAFSLAGPAGAAERKYVTPRMASDPSAPPFSQAVRIGDTLYISGHLGLTPDRKVPDDAETESRLLLDAFKKTVTDGGMTMDDLVFVQVFCSDVAHYDVWNKVYRSYFTKEFPARAFLGSGKLLFGARFELQGIAVKRP